MQAYDLIMLIVLAMATIFGAIKGFAWQVASIASVVVSYFVAYRFRHDVAEMIQAQPPWNQFLAMLILFVGTSFVIWVAFRLLSGTIDRVRLKSFDRQLGASFGLVKGMIYCLLITMFATSLLGPKQQAAIIESRSGHYIATALDYGVGILPREIHDVVGPYLADLDSKLQHDHAGATHSAQDSPPDGGSIWPGLGDNLADRLKNLPALPGGLSDRLPGLPSGAGQVPNPGNVLPPSSFPQSGQPTGTYPPQNSGTGTDTFPQNFGTGSNSLRPSSRQANSPSAIRER